MYFLAGWQTAGIVWTQLCNYHRASQPYVWGRVSHPQHCNIWAEWFTVVGCVGWLAAFSACTQSTSGAALPVVTTKYVSRRCPMSHGLCQNCSQLRTPRTERNFEECLQKWMSFNSGQWDRAAFFFCLFGWIHNVHIEVVNETQMFNIFSIHILQHERLICSTLFSTPAPGP